MAYTTSGHIVTAMPTYHPVDPSLIAFNPSKITEGALQAFQVANQLQQYKAFQAQQAELEATRQARIAAQNAGYGITTETAPGVIAGTNAQNTQIAALAPSATQVGLAQNQGALANLAFTEQLRPSTQETQLKLSQGAAANASSEIDLKAAQTDAALQAIKDQAKVNPPKTALEAAKYADELASLEEDKKRNDALIEAKIREQNALATYAEGRNATSQKNAELRASTHTQLDTAFQNAAKTYSTIAADLNREGAAGATPPPDWKPQFQGQKFTIAEAADAYNQNPTGFLASMGIGGEKATLPYGLKNQIDSYNKLRKDAADSRARMIDIGQKHQALFDQGQGPQSQGGPLIQFQMPGAAKAQPAMPAPAAQVPVNPIQNFQQVPTAPLPANVVNPPTAMPTPAPSSAPSLPTLTPSQAAKLPAGTPFKGTDGRVYTARGPRQ